MFHDKISKSMIIHLINYGFDINQVVEDGMTAVMKSIVFGNVECLELFIHYGIDLSQRYHGKEQELKGYSIFHFAIESGNKGVLPCLLEHLHLLRGCKKHLNVKNRRGQSPLKLANDLRDTYSVKYLLQYKAKLENYKENEC